MRTPLKWFSDIFSGYSHQPLPRGLGEPPWKSRKSSPIRFLALLAVALLAGIILIWKWSRAAYNSLDNYQHLNDISILEDDYVSSLLFPPNSRSVVSSLYSDSFAIGVAVLAHSTRIAQKNAANINGTRFILPYLADRISKRALCIVLAAGWEPHPVPAIPPPHNGKGIHHRFADQYAKLNIWAFDTLGVQRLVYLDADTLVRRSFDELFEVPFSLAAVPDVYGAGDPRGFSVTFNAGVLALWPSSTVFNDMKKKIQTASYPLLQAEQAFLNLYYAGKALRLPYVYNANLAIKQRSQVLWEALRDEMRIVHYTALKPFVDDSRSGETILTNEELGRMMRNAAEKDGGFYREELEWWQEAYESMMHELGETIGACMR